LLVNDYLIIFPSNLQFTKNIKPFI